MYRTEENLDIAVQSVYAVIVTGRGWRISWFNLDNLLSAYRTECALLRHCVKSQDPYLL